MLAKGLIAGKGAERGKQMQFVGSGGFRLIDIDSGLRGGGGGEMEVEKGKGKWKTRKAEKVR